MGTTAEKLQNILNAKNALKTKFNLADDLPFSKYAENITAGSTTGPGQKLIVKGTDHYDGVYIFDGTNYINPDGGYIVTKNHIDTAYADYYALTLGDDVPVYIAEIVNTISGVYRECSIDNATCIVQEYTEKNFQENIKFNYLCSYVNRNYFSYNTIVVSGMPTAPFVGCTYVNENTWETADVPADIAARDPNGTYTLQNPTEQTYNWYWENENGCVIDHWDMGSGQPIIYPDKDYKNTNKYIYVESMAGEIPQYPVPDDYSSYSWTYSSGSGSDTVVADGSVVVPQPEPVEQYWLGYKLYQNADGKWLYDDVYTKLTYGDYMPVIGRIYNEESTAEIGNVDFAEEVLYACPRNVGIMDAIWEVDSTSVYSTNYNWKAFDGDMSTAAWINHASPWWISWANKKRKILLKQIKIYMNDVYPLNKEAFLQGSNDGTEWVDIIPQGNFSDNNTSYENGVSVITLNLPDNGTPYYYIRLGSNYDTGSYSIIYHIEAYAQIPREVPK